MTADVEQFRRRDVGIDLIERRLQIAWLRLSDDQSCPSKTSSIVGVIFFEASIIISYGRALCPRLCTHRAAGWLPMNKDHVNRQGDSEQRENQCDNDALLREVAAQDASVSQLAS
jgi:hypothetical protein